MPVFDDISEAALDAVARSVSYLTRHPRSRAWIVGATMPLRHGRRRVLTGPGRGLRIDLQGSRPSYVLGVAEREVQRLLEERLGPGQVFYDLGANVGFFTLIGARLVGERGHVYSFEPSPHTAAKLRRNVELNRLTNVSVVEKAVGRRLGTALFDVSIGEAAQDARVVVNASPSVVQVNVTSVDSFVSEGARPPTVVKVDVEGLETDAIAGMLHTVRRFQPLIVCEVHQTVHVSEHSVEHMLREAGMVVRWLEPAMSRDSVRWAPHIVASAMAPSTVAD